MAFFAFEMTKNPPVSMIDDLGGTLKIGKINGSVSTSSLRRAFFRRDKEAREELKANLPLREIAKTIGDSCSGKPLFGISIYWSDSVFNSVSSEIQRFIGSSIKQELRTLGCTSDFMGFSRQRKQPQLSAVEVLKKDFVKHM